MNPRPRHLSPADNQDSEVDRESSAPSKQSQLAREGLASEVGHRVRRGPSKYSILMSRFSHGSRLIE